MAQDPSDDRSDGTVELTDLEVIQRFSLAVRGARASRDSVVAALEADLAWLTGGRRARAAAPAEEPAPARRAPARRAAPAAGRAAPARRGRQA